MQLLVPLLSPNTLNNEGYNNQLKEIDNTIMSIAEAQYRNQIYGFKESVDLDFYEILCEKREVLLNEMFGCCNCIEAPYNTPTGECNTIVCPPVDNNTDDMVTYTVGNNNSPVSGTNEFTTTVTLLNNQAVWITLNGEGTLIQNYDYVLSGSPITITLQNGRLFNTEEVYTIFIYTI